MAKLRVYGMEINRTVLGIVNAYLELHPNTTSDELRVVFRNGVGLKQKEIFAETNGTGNMVSPSTEGTRWFSDAGEIIQTADKKRLVMNADWSKEEYLQIVLWADSHGIKAMAKSDRSYDSPIGFAIENEEPEVRFMERLGIGLDMRSKMCPFYMLVTLLFLFTILLFMRGCSDESTRTADGSNTETGETVDLHSLALKQKKIEQETYEMFQEEEIQNARQLTEETERAANSLLE